MLYAAVIFVSFSVSSVSILCPILTLHCYKYEYGLRPITEDIIKEQEKVADFWFRLKLIPNKPDVRAGFLKPEEYEFITPKGVLALAK